MKLFKSAQSSETKSTFLIFSIYALITMVLFRENIFRLQTGVFSGLGNSSLFIWEFNRLHNSFLHANASLFFTRDIMFPVGTHLLMTSPWNAALGAALQLFFDPYVTFNLLYLLSFALAGVAMYVLVHYLTKDRFASFCAGFFFMFSHYSLNQHLLGHLQEASIYFIPVLFLGTLKVWHQQRWGLTIFISGIVGICANSTYMVFEILLVGLPFFLIVQWYQTKPESRPPNAWRTFAMGYAIAIALSLFFYEPVLAQMGHWLGSSQIYSNSLISFIDLPSWHPSRYAQALRTLTSQRFVVESQSSVYASNFVAPMASVENLQAYLGFVTLVLIVIGFVKKKLTDQLAWWALGILGLVLSLGPFLQINFTPTHVALPYWLILKLPLLDQFKTPSRFMVLTWTAANILVGITLSRIWPGKSWNYRVLITALIIVSYSWEMGLGALGEFWTPLELRSFYQQLGIHNSGKAIFELPISIHDDGQVSPNAQRYMLYAPIHQCPIVLGRPSRHTVESLSFCQNQDFVFELTHPWVIESLYTDARLAPRLQNLRLNGREILRTNNIGYVLFHTDDRLFDVKAKNAYLRLLGDVIGAPDYQTAGVIVFKVS